MRKGLWMPRGPGLLSRREALALGMAGAAFAAVPRRATAQSAAKPPPSKPTGQVVVGLSQEPTVFNPLMPHIEVDQGVHWNVFSPLWSVNAQGQFVPQLATDVPTIGNGGISEDGLEWRVKLRSGVLWHDGTPF
ncbi:MAG TPA: ABC transporter substrate-binding protein, partial [Acetobacteraceae bacterium]|nr:ABC transporter substrate-binding protein [Acetobacteraceae bacterium]